MGGECVAFLLAVARRRRACGRGPPHHRVLAVRLCTACDTRFAAAQRGDRYQQQADPVAAFVIAGTVAGLAGALFAYLKGSVFPDNMGISLSVDALVMVLLG